MLPLLLSPAHRRKNTRVSRRGRRYGQLGPRPKTHTTCRRTPSNHVDETPHRCIDDRGSDRGLPVHDDSGGTSSRPEKQPAAPTVAEDLWQRCGTQQRRPKEVRVCLVNASILALRLHERIKSRDSIGEVPSQTYPPNNIFPLLIKSNRWDATQVRRSTDCGLLYLVQISGSGSSWIQQTRR